MYANLFIDGKFSLSKENLQLSIEYDYKLLNKQHMILNNLLSETILPSESAPDKQIYM